MRKSAPYYKGTLLGWRKKLERKREYLIEYSWKFKNPNHVIVQDITQLLAVNEKLTRVIDDELARDWPKCDLERGNGKAVQTNSSGAEVLPGAPASSNTQRPRSAG